MYFPYLKGKQFELIALRELSERMGESGSIHPVIEPVKSTVTRWGEIGRKTMILHVRLDSIAGKEQRCYCIQLKMSTGKSRHIWLSL